MVGDLRGHLRVESRQHRALCVWWYARRASRESCLCLLKRPFLLRRLMLWPTMDTLLGDDVGAPVPPHDAAVDDPLLLVPRTVPHAFGAGQGHADSSSSNAARRWRRFGDSGGRWPASSIRTACGLNGPAATTTGQPSDLRESRDRRDGFSTSHLFQPAQETMCATTSLSADWHNTLTARAAFRSRVEIWDWWADRLFGRHNRNDHEKR